MDYFIKKIDIYDVVIPISDLKFRVTPEKVAVTFEDYQYFFIGNQYQPIYSTNLKIFLNPEVLYPVVSNTDIFIVFAMEIFNVYTAATILRNTYEKPFLNLCLTNNPLLTPFNIRSNIINLTVATFTQISIYAPYAKTCSMRAAFSNGATTLTISRANHQILASTMNRTYIEYYTHTAAGGANQFTISKNGDVFIVNIGLIGAVPANTFTIPADEGILITHSISTFTNLQLKIT